MSELLPLRSFFLSFLPFFLFFVPIFLSPSFPFFFFSSFFLFFLSPFFPFLPFLPFLPFFLSLPLPFLPLPFLPFLPFLPLPFFSALFRPLYLPSPFPGSALLALLTSDLTHCRAPLPLSIILGTSSVSSEASPTALLLRPPKLPDQAEQELMFSLKLSKPGSPAMSASITEG